MKKQEEKQVRETDEITLHTLYLYSFLLLVFLLTAAVAAVKKIGLYHLTFKRVLYCTVLL